MVQIGINLENVKVNNRSAVLRLLNGHGAMSRKDIAGALGLTPASVTQICSDLLAAGVVQELGELQEDKRAGRKKILVGINYQVRYGLTITIEGTEATIAISDLRGEVVSMRRVSKADGQNVEEFLDRLCVESKLLMWENSIPREKVLGVGVSVPGNVNRAAGICQHPLLTGGASLALVSILQEKLGLPVIMENNVKAFAQAGLVYGKSQEPESLNTLFLKWGPGVGSAMILDGTIYEGHSAKAAELGHIRVPGNPRRCRCGRIGCLETIASTHALADAVRDAFSPQQTPLLWAEYQGNAEQLRAGNIQQWMRLEDEGVWKVLDGILSRLAETVCGIITMIAPDQVVLYGYLFELPNVQEHFIDFCKEYDPRYDETLIFRSQLSDKIDYIGPLAVIMDEYFLSGRALGTLER